MADSGHAPARVVGGVRHPAVDPAARHADSEGTAQTTVVSALDGNANNSALVSQEVKVVHDAAEKKVRTFFLPFFSFCFFFFLFVLEARQAS